MGAGVTQITTVRRGPFEDQVVRFGWDPRTSRRRVAAGFILAGLGGAAAGGISVQAWVGNVPEVFGTTMFVFLALQQLPIFAQRLRGMYVDIRYYLAISQAVIAEARLNRLLHPGTELGAQGL
jgi:hypothetical protein